MMWVTQYEYFEQCKESGKYREILQCLNSGYLFFAMFCSLFDVNVFEYDVIYIY